MRSDSRRHSVSELITAGKLEIGDGYRAKNAELADEGLPFARAGNINGGFDFEGADRVPPETLARVGSKRSRAGDVVFTSKGTVGRFAWVRDETEEFVYSPQLCYWRSLDRDVIDRRFLFYWMQGPECLSQINALKGQTDMADYVSLRDQRAMTVTLPSIELQRVVTATLGSIEDALERSVRTATALRAVVLLAAKRLPGSAVPLAASAAFINGGALTKLSNGKGPPILRIKELRSGITDETPRTDVEVRDEHDVTFGDLLFSWSGTLLTTRWTGEDAVLNQHIFRVDPLDGVPTWLVEGWIEQHLPAFRRIAADKTTTMGHIQRRHLSEAMVNMPDADGLRELDARYTPLDRLRMGLLKEARTLRAIRDELLPKLVSGKIRVPLADEIADAGDEAALEEAEAV